MSLDPATGAAGKVTTGGDSSSVFRLESPTVVDKGDTTEFPVVDHQPITSAPSVNSTLANTLLNDSSERRSERIGLVKKILIT